MPSGHRPEGNHAPVTPNVRPDAVAQLPALRAEYADRLAALPENLRGSTTAEVLTATTDLGLDTLADTEPPKGYGRG